MSKLNYLLLSLFLLTGFSCTEDPLKFDLKEIEEITISGIKTTYTVELGRNLEITPTVTAKFGLKDDQMEFIWYKYKTDGGSEADTIGHEKNLDVPIFDVEPGISHNVILKVVNKMDGTFTSAKTVLLTTTEFSGGIVALVKTDGEVDISFLKNGTNEPVNNLFSSSNNGKKLPSTSTKIFNIDAVPAQPAIYRRILVATEDENIGLYLSPDIFEVTEKVSDLFFVPLPSDVNYSLKGTYNDQTTQYLFINDKVYDREIDIENSNDMPKFNSELRAINPSEQELSPFMLQPRGQSGRPMVFDNLNGRFMYRPFDKATYSFFTKIYGFEFNFFDPGKLTGMTMLSSGYNSSLATVWMLMNDSNTNTRRLLGMSLQYDAPHYTTVNKEVDRVSAPNLYLAKNFISGSNANVLASSPYTYSMEGVSNVFFYIVNNKLYIYNIAADYEGMIVNGDVEGFDIDDVFVHSTYLVNEDDESEAFARVGLAIRDRKSSGKKGGVAYYRINYVGGITAKQYFMKTGFCDQVISFVEKPN